MELRLLMKLAMVVAGVTVCGADDVVGGLLCGSMLVVFVEVWTTSLPVSHILMGINATLITTHTEREHVFFCCANTVID